MQFRLCNCVSLADPVIQFPKLRSLWGVTIATVPLNSASSSSRCSFRRTPRGHASAFNNTFGRPSF
eukprot:3283091-Amphidinium_carterae.1